MKSKLILGAVALVLASQVSVSALDADRPDFSESASTLPVGRFQLEAGYTAITSDPVEHVVGEGLLRFGFMSGTEFRLSLPSLRYLNSRRGLTDSGVGIKQNLLSGNGQDIPKTSVILQTSIPSGAAAYKNTDLQLLAKLCMDWTLSTSDGLSVNLNYGSVNSGDDRFTQTSVSASLSHSFSKDWGMFVESYATFPETQEGNSSQVISTGVIYSMNENLQFDLRAGKTLTDSTAFVGAGTAFRF